MSSLAVKYRPRTFEEHVGQEHIVKALKNALKTKRISSGYLFAGMRGIGKTTTARIFAKGLNCESYNDITDEPCGKCRACVDIENSRHVDVIEIDGASNRGIDEVRAIRESVKFLPARGRKKVYIIDEAHMLTIEAFNALLKTLEEPPPHVVFILATTDPNKLPKTILSRLQKYEFKPISPFDIIRRLRFIAENEGIEIDDSAINEIARRSEGSLRDAISMLEQVWLFKQERITYRDVLDTLGAVERERMEKLLSLIHSSDTSGALDELNSLLSKITLTDFIREFSYFLSDKLKDVLSRKDKNYTKEDILMYMNQLLNMEQSIKNSIVPGIWAEFFIAKMSILPKSVALDQILRSYNLTYTRKQQTENKPKEEQTESLPLNEKLANKLDRPFLKGAIISSSISLENDKIVIRVSSSEAKRIIQENIQSVKEGLNSLGLNFKEISIVLDDKEEYKHKLIELFKLKEVK